MEKGSNTLKTRVDPDDGQLATLGSLDPEAPVAGQVLAALGGRVVFTTTVEQVMIGPPAPKWDVAAIMYFPTRRAFVEMTMNPEFQPGAPKGG